MMMQASSSKATKSSVSDPRRLVDAVLPRRLLDKTERRRLWVEVALPRGSSSEAERPWRAAALTLAGATTVLFFSYPRKLSLTTVQWLGLWGQLVSMVAIVLAIFMLVYPRAANVIGPFAIICGILSFPIILGGLLVGSICLIVGGALAFAWMPAPPEARAYASRAPHTHLLLPFRILADTIDGVLFMLAAVITGYTFLHGPMKDSPALVYLVQLVIWAAIFIPGTARGVTPGKLLLRLRIWDTVTMEPPGLQRAVIREATRGAEFVGLLILIPLLFDVPQILAFAMIATVAIAGVASAHLGVMPHDLLAGTGISLLHVVLPEDDMETREAVDGESALSVEWDVPPVDTESIAIPEPARQRVGSAVRAQITEDDEYGIDTGSLVESLDAVLTAATGGPTGRPARGGSGRDRSDSIGKGRVRKTTPK